MEPQPRLVTCRKLRQDGTHAFHDNSGASGSRAPGSKPGTVLLYGQKTREKRRMLRILLHAHAHGELGRPVRGFDNNAVHHNGLECTSL